MSWKKIIKFVFANKVLLLALFLLLPVYYLLYEIYIPRANAFGCFDDCNNFMRGYFFLHGNPLFSHVFSGHQPLGSYLSALVQFVTNPQSIYELILRHRQFILVFGLLSNILLILRFGPKMIIFTIIFEFSKFYIFGDRFLGDSMIVYLLAYMAGLVLLKAYKRKIYAFDYFLAGFFCWFVVFMREAYIPAALFLFLIVLWDRPLKKYAVISFVLFSLISLVSIFVHDVKEYFFNVVTFNFQINLPAEGRLEMFGPRYLHWFFYPIYIFFYGPINLFKILLITINISFLTLFTGLIIKRKLLLAFYIFIFLGLTNIRVVWPGELFYSSFHMVPWYGLVIFVTIFLIFEQIKNKKLLYMCIAVISAGFIYMISSPEYFAKEKIDPHTELINNYGHILQQGEVIKSLSKKGDTLFLDASDDMIYWQSGLFSNYKYVWYTSAMPAFEKYTDERLRMFGTNPPDFYREYGSCPKENPAGENYSLPEFVKDNYVRLIHDGSKSCIFIHTDKLGEISSEQLEKAGEWLYYLPDEKN